MSPKQSVQFILSILLLSSVIVGCDSPETPGLESWEIVFSTEFGRMPRWSPDGERVLFGDDRVGQSGLWLWTPGQEPTILNDTLPQHDWDYRWSPDGSQIAFSSPGEAGAELAGIWVVEVDGDSLWRVYDRGRDVSWRSSGNSIVFRNDFPRAGDDGIYEVDLATGEALGLLGGFKPSCSPTGDWVATADGEIDARLYLWNGIIGREVTERGAVQWEWSAEGNALCAVVNQYTSGSQKGVLTRINIDGDDISIDSSLTGWAAFPAPNRDATQIAFLRQSNSRWVGLWIHRDGGGEPQVHDYGENPHYCPNADLITINAPGGGIRVLRRMR